MKKRLLFILFSAGLFYNSFAQKVYEFSPVCQAAYAEIIKLKLEPGQELLEQAKKENPNNLIPYFLESYIDFFVLFFNEDPAEFAVRKAKYEKRDEMFEDAPHNTPFYRYCKATNLLQRAAIRIKFGERFGAGWDFKKAYGILKSNREEYPWFQPNNMVYSPLYVAVGTIPKGYKWVTNLLGIKGSIKGGMEMMRDFLNSNDPYAKLFNAEAAFYYCYLTNYIENKPEEVFKYIQTNNLDVVNNHLYAYMAVNLGINNKKTEYAKNIWLNKNPSPDYLQTPVWDFEMGFIKLHQLKLQEAAIYFDRFVRNFKGNFYVKDALQKISWAYYLQGNKPLAEKYRQLCLSKGNTDSDADKKAYKEARKGEWPNEILLKARLLNDGGYHREALAQLAGKSEADFYTPEDALEFVYRCGRILDDLNRDDEAIKYYQRAIHLGRSRTEYYASRAALQTGYIYEKRGQCQTAIAYFNECIGMDDHDYKDSMDQRAKSGISRCKGE